MANEFPSAPDFNEVASPNPTDQLAAQYAQSRGTLVKYVSTLLGPNYAEDSVQDAFLGALKQIQTRPDNADSLGTGYIARSARNSAISLRRRKWFSETPIDYDDSRSAKEENAQPAQDPFSLVAEKQGIETALDRLTPGDAKVLQLRVLGGFSVGETAAKLGIPAGTVKSRLNRALGRLRDMPDITDLLTP